MGNRRIILVAVVLAAAGWTASSAEAQSGPVVHWRGDDGTAPATAADSSGNGTSGTYQSGATTSTLVPTLQFANPASMSFDGVDDHLQHASFSWPSGGPITIAFWNLVAAADVRNTVAFNIGGLVEDNSAYATVPWGDNMLHWEYGSTPAGSLAANYQPHLGKWTHVVLVSEGNGGAFKAIYLDGILAASEATSDGPDAALTGLEVGRFPNYPHKGLIDDFRLYDRVLSAKEVAVLAYGIDGTVPPPTGLQATGSNRQVSLQWTAPTVGDVTEYRVYRSLVSGSGHQPVATVSGATSTVDTGLENGWTYSYVVRSIDGAAESVDSNEATAMALAPPRTQEVGGERNPCGFGAAGSPGLATLIALASGLLLMGRRRPNPRSLSRPSED